MCEKLTSKCSCLLLPGALVTLSLLVSTGAGCLLLFSVDRCEILCFLTGISVCSTICRQTEITFVEVRLKKTQLTRKK